MEYDLSIKYKNVQKLSFLSQVVLNGFWRSSVLNFFSVIFR